MLTFDYLKTISKRDLTSKEISDEMSDLCTLFDLKYHNDCKRIVNNEFNNFGRFNPSKNTTQQFCYSITACKKPGPPLNQQYRHYNDQDYQEYEEPRNNYQYKNRRNYDQQYTREETNPFKKLANGFFDFLDNL